MIPLSVAIITLNEEKNLERCLHSLGSIASEIVVVDSGSTDGTAGIARANGATLIEHPFEGHIQQKNVALSRCTYDHVLSLDADEALSDELRTSIGKVLEEWKHDAYAMNRCTNYCGSWIRHGGWYPDKKVRLFRRSEGEWTGINPHDEFRLLRPDATVGRLTGDLLHFSYNSIADHLRQIEYFTEITASEYERRGRRAPLWRILLAPGVRFMRDYIFRGGFRDGFEGLVIAVLSSYAVFIKYAKLRHKTRRGSYDGR